MFLVTIYYRTSHLHPDYEAILVLDNPIQLISQKLVFKASRGDLLLLNPNQPHELLAETDKGSTLLCLQVSPKFFREIAPSLDNLYFDTTTPFQILPLDKREKLTTYFMELGLQYQMKLPFYELFCMALTSMIFNLLFTNLPVHKISHNERRALEKKVERLSRIVDYLNNNYMNRVRLSDIAQAENLSLSHLSLFIKENLNQTFQDYVNTLRFNQARKLIATTDKRLIDICMETGFSDPRYLTKAFVDRTGMTPDAYRKKYKEDKSDMTKQRNPHSSERYYTPEDTIQILRKAQASLCKPLVI